MQIIIPMAGRGSRFLRAGYQQIKPLIVVEGRPIIEHIVGLFPEESDFLFICAEDHLQKTNLKEVLKRIAPVGTIISIPPHKLGPVHTVLAAARSIKKASPAIVSYCDYSVKWDYRDFTRQMNISGCAAGVPSYRGFHPHSLGPNLYAYMRVDGTKVLEIREKQAFTTNRMNEFASAGLYYFSSGKNLCRYFEQAIIETLTTNGEYYASLPLNLLIRDGLPVQAYEVPYFLQWGTPEDLEEYKNWSENFSDYAAHRSPLGEIEGTVVVPMAGLGTRFQKEGYLLPKPLIPVDGIPMIGRVLDSLPISDKRLLICHSELELPLRRQRVLKKTDTVIALSSPTDGAVSTCLLAENQIDPDRPLLIAACDSVLIYDFDILRKLIDDTSIDFVAFTFKNHPHANRNPKQYAWVKNTSSGDISALSCKTPLSNTPWNDLGITGTFWFRKASDFLSAAKELKKENAVVNGEFYIDSTIPLLAQNRKRGRCLSVDRFLCFGIPDDVRTFEYWAAFFRANKDTKVLSHDHAKKRETK